MKLPEFQRERSPRDIAGVTYLDLSGTGIKDIVLDRFPALTSVDLSGNRISDLTPLAG